METEPVLSVSAITSAVSAVIVALVAVGVLTLSDGQMQAITAAVGAVLVVVTQVSGGLWLKPRTTPLAKPVDNGVPLVQATDGQPGVTAAKAGRSIVKATARGAQPGPTTTTVKWSK